MTTVDVQDIIYALVFGAMVIFGVKYISGMIQAWAAGASDKQYRALAERTAAAQLESQKALSAIQAELAKMASSLGEIEKILKQVE
ncbi:MAG TPA: hypothetical protein VME63_02025 [Dyella sp.]|uniref:hypothetical protein n=1 Tax=Dyella sp. TaxID=1869338 RepID=UPI002CA5976E|nr:hypothetical protein [Dyella sp.]HTV84150.1 hypothetical protein [Dyella sp.]